MTNAEQAALDLIAEMEQMLIDMKAAADERDRKIAALMDECATLHADWSDASSQVSERRVWFDTFRAAAQPPAMDAPTA